MQPGWQLNPVLRTISIHRNDGASPGKNRYLALLRVNGQPLPAFVSFTSEEIVPLPSWEPDRLPCEFCVCVGRLGDRSHQQLSGKGVLIGRLVCSIFVRVGIVHGEDQWFSLLGIVPICRVDQWQQSMTKLHHLSGVLQDILAKTPWTPVDEFVIGRMKSEDWTESAKLHPAQI